MKKVPQAGHAPRGLEISGHKDNAIGASLFRLRFGNDLGGAVFTIAGQPGEGRLSLDYFARGGTIHHLPTPERTAISDILEYLQSCNLVVYAAPLGDGEPKYVYQGAVVTLQTLVIIANEHRALRRLPPFQLIQQT